MYDANTHSFCSEFYTIEKSIEVVVTIQGEADRIRIDALRDATTGDYCTTAYIETHLCESRSNTGPQKRSNNLTVAE